MSFVKPHHYQQQTQQQQTQTSTSYTRTMARGGYYAVANGRSEGVYSTWGEAEALVKGYSGAKYKKFATMHEAQAFVAANSTAQSTPAPARSAAAVPTAYRINNTTAIGSNGDNDDSRYGHAKECSNMPAASRKHARSMNSRSSGDNTVASMAPPAKRAHIASSSNTADTIKPPTFYAVAEGHNTGVVSSWSQVVALTQGYVRPVFRKFASRADAEAFVADYTRTSSRHEPRSSGAVTTPSSDTAAAGSTSHAALDSSSYTTDTSTAAVSLDTTTAQPRTPLLTEEVYYAVASGRRTGVFDTWRDAKQQIDGLFSARYRKFTNRADAEAFVERAAESAKPLASDPDPQHDTDALVAFCDGSALQNGQRNCAAGYACVFPHRPEWNVAKQLVEPRATNNRAEYFAALEALKRANIEDATQRAPLFVFSDSMLLIRSMTEWVATWQQRQWRKADGTPVLNRDILEQLVAAQGSRRIVWRHVKAHTGKRDWHSKWNDVADRKARNAASR